MLSGNIFKTIESEIFHFVQDDNQLVIYLGGVGWRLRRQPTPPKTKALKHCHFDRREKSQIFNRTLMNLNR
jgi:hypothetical protein